MLKEGNFQASPGGQAMLEDYYRRYALPRWRIDANRAALADFRRELTRSELGAAKGGGPPHDLVVQIAIETLSAYAKDERLHPAVRYNAMLALGELNATESAAPNVPPVPSPDALAVLLSTLEDPKASDVVKVAALVGLVRHVALGIADQNTRDSRVVPVLEHLATGANMPADRTPEVHAWMRELAIEGLGRLGSTGQGGSIARLLSDIAADKNAPASSRRAAMQALGALKYAGAAGVDPSQLARAVGEALRDLCSQELQSARTKKRVVSQRLLKTYVEDASKTLNTLAEVASAPPHKPYVEKLIESVQGISNLANAREFGGDALARQLTTALTKLATALAETPASEPARPTAASAPTT